ncbi:hypothetical protein Cgig2_027210 [Carnegiea gigantea]|uniref:TF-B3 domain-containing protein n=1 Tax=Carnegiea gigantea TaxID=171969 RepID=A0A9Q1GKD4_9CARY|nr:hypothetical protein Cgig2_027210 [Carnegiea gigantea]
MTSNDLEQRFFHRSTHPALSSLSTPAFRPIFSYLNQKEEDNEEITATLTDSKKEKVWRVRIVRTEEDGKQLKLKQGWEDFFKDHDELGAGDFVVFEHHDALSLLILEDTKYHYQPSVDHYLSKFAPPTHLAHGYIVEDTSEKANKQMEPYENPSEEISAVYDGKVFRKIQISYNYT